MSINLHTISVDDLPVVILNVDAEQAVPDFVVTNPELLKAHRTNENVRKMMQPADREIAFQMEIDEALDTWLGDDLKNFRYAGAPVWNGDRTRLQVRQALPDEAARWRISYEKAVLTGERDAGDENWLAFLIEVSE